MRLSVDEIFGLNSLLDGKKIWGFNEVVDSDMSYEKKVSIASKLKEYGEKGIQGLLALLNAYKNSDNYVVINGYNVAVLEEGLLGLVKVEDDYQFFSTDMKWFADYIKNEKKVFMIQYRNGEICKFELVNKKDNKRYLFNMLNQEKVEIESNDIETFLERYLG